jgi:hypothetical protein
VSVQKQQTHNTQQKQDQGDADDCGYIGAAQFALCSNICGFTHEKRTDDTLISANVVKKRVFTTLFANFRKQK